MPNYIFSGWNYTGNNPNGRDYVYQDDREEIKEELALNSFYEEIKLGYSKFKLENPKKSVWRFERNNKKVEVRFQAEDNSSFGYRWEYLVTIKNKK